MFWIGRSALRGVRLANDVKGRTILLRSAKKASVYSIESEELEKINVVRVQAMKDKAVFAKMLDRQEQIKFQVDCGACANILPLKCAEGEELTPCSETLVMWNGT